MSTASRDDNFVTTLLAVSSVDGVTPVTLYADPTTHRLLVDGTVQTALYGPLDAPTAIGTVHIDTDSGEIYMSTGTSAIGDWKLLTATTYTLSNAITEQGDNRIFENGTNKVRE